MRTRREPRYRTSPVPGFRGARIRHLLGGASVAAAGGVIGLGAAGGTYAYFDDQTAVGRTATVTAGTAELEVDASFSAAEWGNLLVGESVRQPYTIENRGDVPLVLVAAGTSSSGDVELRTVAGACPGSALTGAAITASSAMLGTLAAGASMTACLEVRLVSGAPGTSATVTVDVSGSQAP